MKPLNVERNALVEVIATTLLSYERNKIIVENAPIIIFIAMSTNHIARLYPDTGRKQITRDKTTMVMLEIMFIMDDFVLY